MSNKTQIVIEPDKSFLFNLRSLTGYRDLLYFLVLRDIKVIYKQSVLGIGWAIIKPVVTMLVFTIIFGKIANLRTDGLPDFIFYYSGLVPWIYFSSATVASSSSLSANSHILTKVYFPRMILPFTPVLSKLMDFFISLILLLAMMFWFGFYPNINILFFPLILLILILTIAGFGLWLSALSVQYRDVNHAAGFFIQLLLYVSPVIISLSYIPDRYKTIYSFNPLVGIVEGFRSTLLGTNPMPWDLILPGLITTIFIFITGLIIFNKTEKYFADVV